MTSKERLLKCIKHQPIDRVPISTFELVGWNDSAWENKEPSYKKLMDHIREYTDCIYMKDPVFKNYSQSIAHIEKWDDGKSHFTKTVYPTGKGDISTLHRFDDGIQTVWTLKHLLEDIDDIDKFLSIPYTPPEVDMEDFFSEQGKLGDRGLMMITIGDPVCDAASLFEMSTFLLYAMCEPEKTKYFLDALFERQMYSLRQILKHNVKDVVFRICGPEYITPPYLSPNYFNNYSTCYLIDICKEIRTAGGIPRIHSHGKIGKVIEQFALTDAEMLEPIEPIPDGDIDLSEVKRLYGKKFCLMGNIELKELETSDQTRIDYLVRECMQKGKTGSGFILMPTAAPINIPLSIKTQDNYIQMIESALKYGVY